MYDETTGDSLQEGSAPDTFEAQPDTGADRRTIERFAAGEWDLRSPAYKAYMRIKNLRVSDCSKHIAFMREVVEPTNLGLRMEYRSNLLESIQ